MRPWRDLTPRPKNGFAKSWLLMKRRSRILKTTLKRRRQRPKALGMVRASVCEMHGPPHHIRRTPTMTPDQRQALAASYLAQHLWRAVMVVIDEDTSVGEWAQMSRRGRT